MKNWIRNNLQLVVVTAVSLFVIAVGPTNAEAQGRQKSNSGKSETVERKSGSKAKGKAVSSSRGDNSKKAVKRSTSSGSSSGKKTTGRAVQDKSSKSSRVIKRNSSSTSSNSSKSRSTQKATSSGRTTSSAGDQRKTVNRVVTGSNSDKKSSGGRTVDRGNGQSGNDSGVRGGSRSGSGGAVRGDGRSGKDSGVRGGGSGSGSDSRASGRDGDSRSNSRGVVNNNGRGSSGITVTRDGKRSRYTGPVIKNPKKAKKYKYNNKHKWQNTYFRPDRVRVNVYPRSWNRHVHVSSHVHLGFRWPWQYRQNHHWRPRYRYRQVIYVNVGWGRNQRQSRIDVRTYYNQRVRHANADYAEVEIDIDAIELFQDGRFIGYVDKIPSSLREINAVVYANGRVEFDRNVFLVGDTYRGFEMISTRYYDDYLLNSYDRGHGVRVGRLDLRKERVKKISRSRLFNPYDFNGNVPHSLLPEDDRLFDYSYEYLSGYYDDRDRGYGNGFYGNNSPQYNSLQDYESGMARIDEVSYSTQIGASIDLTRESVVERVDY